MPGGKRFARFAAVVALATLVSAILPPSAAASLEPPRHLAVVHQVEGGDERRIILLHDVHEGLRGELVDLLGRDAIQPTWSPDGSTLLFSAQTGPGGPFALFTVRPGGVDEFPLPNQSLEQISFPAGVDEPTEGDFSAAWSPDGQWIAFARKIDGTSKIYYRFFGTATQERLTSDPWSYEVEPSWMPDSTTVVFANRAFDPALEPEQDPNHAAYRFQIVKASTLRRTFATTVAGAYGVDFRTPDVSPDGTTIAAAATLVAFGGETHSAMVTSATGFYDLGVFAGDRNPDWSPDGSLIVADFGDAVVVDGISGPGPSFGTEGSDASWRGREQVPPSVLITPTVDDDGWLAHGNVEVVARDDASGILLLECSVDGHGTILRDVFDPSRGLPTEHIAIAEVTGPEGHRVLTCMAQDGSGNVASTSVDILVDFDAPILGTPVFATEPIRHGDTVEVRVPFTENGSGIDFALGAVTSDTGSESFAMEVVGDDLVGVVQPPAGIHWVEVTARDRRGNVATVRSVDLMMVFDPSAGPINGSGSIVPGGTTSDPGDTLPGLDGRAKATFSFGAEYRTDTSALPSGHLSVNLTGGRFSFKATSLSWVVRSGSTALVEGTGEIPGEPGARVFRMFVEDGAVDRFELRIWRAGGRPSSDPPQFQATGDVDGNVRVRG